MFPEQSAELWPGWKTAGVLGQGSFGTVYEIRRDVLGEEEKAALKVISIPQNAGELDEMYSEGYDEQSIRQNLESQLKSIVAEYSLMRKLNSCANVVHCDDVRYEQKPDGIGWNIYIKMELLTPMLKGFPQVFSEQSVIRFGKEICNALAYCEHYSIIHRDIKPQNIFLDDTGSCKLGDFGIAKTIEKTSGGTKIGTFKYMAPEVYNNRPYGSAADIYSAGLVLYWLLNERRLPFVPLPPEPVLAGVDGDAANKRMMGTPIPAPRNGSDGLKRIVLKACAFDPKERYTSAEEMRKALEELERMPIMPRVPQPEISGDATVAVRKAASSPVSVPSQPPVTPPAPPVEQTKSKKGILVFSILLLVLLAGGITAFFLFSPGKKTADADSSISDDMVTVFLMTEASSPNYKEVFEYDDNGNPTLVVDYDHGVEFYRYEYEYDDNGNQILIVVYDHGVESYRYEYEYDDNGNQILEVYYIDGVEFSRYEYEYDDNGNRILMVECRNGVESSRCEYEYDDNGNLILKVGYDHGVESDRCKYEYDDNGNPILEVSYNDGVEFYRYEYEYDDNGNQILEVYYYDGVESYRWEYEYDDNGIVKRMTRIYEGEQEIYNTTYQAFRMTKSEAEALSERKEFPYIIIQQ